MRRRNPCIGSGKRVPAVFLLLVILMACLFGREWSLQKAQREFQLMLEQQEGNYNENRVVLSATTPAEARTMANEFGGTLRITKNGKFAVINLPEGMTLTDIAENDDYRKYHGRILLDYNNFSTADEDTADDTEIRSGYVVEDPMYAQQIYIDYLNIGGAWDLTRGADSDGEKTVVAIIDTGIDTDHPEFYDINGNSIISTQSYDATNDKVVDQYDISVIEDTYGHGTAVAGIIAAQMNEAGIAGIAPDVELLVIKCETDEAGEFRSSADIVFAIYYAIEMDVDVINMSLGGGIGADMEKALQLAVDSDIICVAAAGNDSTDAPHYPAAFDTVIGVGALAEDSWEIAGYSNYAVNSDIMAPGTALTAAVGGEYTYQSGTSISAPMVSAAAALYKAQNKYVTYNQMKAELLAAGKDLGDPGEDLLYGFGALDINAFICEEKGIITYDYCTEEIETTTQVFVRSHTIQTVPEPERENIIFDDWYYDKSYTRVFDYDAWYSTEFVEDVTLYAKWVNEDDEDASVYNYRTLDDGTIEIVNYKGKRRYLTIPNEIDGKIVSSIGAGAFANNTRLREVTFPEGLVYIKANAFAGVSKMREIIFTGVKLREIQDNAFSDCSSLRKLDLPDSVITIGKKAFNRCGAMTSVVISENSNLNNIGNFAFSGTAVNSFYIPKNVTSEGFNGSVLVDCSNMRTISVHPGNTAFTVSDSTLYNAEKTKIVYHPSALTGSYAVADGVESIGSYAFCGSSITKLELNSVMSIGDMAFASTRKLTSVVLPDTVTSLGSGAFQYSSITQVTLSENIVAISDSAFYCSKLTGVHIPEGVQAIDSSAFSNCRYLQTLTFADNAKLQSIGRSAFSSCGILTDFELPELLESIGNNAFANCRAITSLTIPANVSSMGNSAFSGCSLLQYVDFADDCKLTEISDSCFAYCTTLHTVNFSDYIMHLGSSAFSNDRLLCNLNFSENSGLTTVGDSCFYACSALQTMQLPDSVTRIGQFAYAFSGLNRADIHANVSGIGNGAFGACYLLTEISVDEENTAYAAVDNVLFSKDISTVFCVPASRMGSYALPESVKITAPFSFYYDKFLTEVILPAGLEDIQMNSFYSCSSLAGIEIPASVTNIGRKAFENCWQMEVLSFESGSRLERLGIYTFVNCGITEVTIPASVEEIAQYVFYNCNNLRKVTFEENSALTYIAAYLFTGTRVDTVVFEEGSALTSLQAHAFSGATYLKTVDFGNAKITNVDNYAFYNCAQLEDVTIPDTVTYVGRYAFYGCAKLDRIDLPKSVDYIGESAFVGTDSIRVFFAADELPAYVQVDWDKGISGYFLGAVDYVVTDEWEYSVRSDGTIALSAYKGSAGELTIDVLDGYTVSRIGARCFYNNDTLTSLKLSENIMEIGNYAFYDCDTLTAVIVPASVEKIGKHAFADSSISVSFADSPRLKIIDDYAFSGNTTTSLALPDSVTQIGDGAFLNSSLTVITISQSSCLETIGQQAFAGSSITEIYLPASMKTVGDEAFKNAINLTNVEIAAGDVGLKLSNGAFEGSGITEITIPARVWYIGEYTLGSCRNLQNIFVDSANTSYTSLDGVLCDIEGTTLIQYPCGRSGAYEVPAHIKVLTYSSFRDAKNLTEVTFAEGSTVRTIGWKTFSGCENLRKITVPDTVVSFDFYAFENCTALTDVILGEETQLTGVYEGAFYNCNALVTITLPDAIVEISDYAFYNCSALAEFPLSENSQVKGIYDYAFYGCSGITEIPALQQLVEVGSYAFAYTNITEFSIGAAVKDVASNAFIGCERFTTIHCDEANEEYVAIDGALYEKGSTDAFDFETLIIWPENKAYVIGSGVSCLRRSDTYILDTISAQYIKVADTVTEISPNAFSYFRKLRKVEIPDSVTTIGSNAFSGCVELKEVILPESITAIDAYVFSGCAALQEIAIPSSVTVIDAHAFDGCVALQKMHLPEGVVQIRNLAFNNCSGLKSLVIPESVTQIDDYAFDGCTALEELYYNAVNLPDFEADSNVFRDVAKYNEYGTKVIVGANVTRIPAYLFYAKEAWVGYDTQNIYSVTFEEGSICTEIGQYAFAENHGLTYFDLPEGLLTISKYAFDECKKLISLMIPTSVTSIGDFAFSGCHSLTVMHRAKEYPSERAYSPAASICENVRSYGITENGQFYCVTNDDTVIVSKYHGSDPILTIPAEIEGYPVTTIAKCAFEGNETVAVVVISEGITEIRYHAFSARDQLLAVQVPESVEVANTAFAGKRLVLMLPGDTYLGSDSLPSNAVANVTEWGFSEEQFLYFVTKDGIAVAGAYLGEESSVEIPDQIHGIPVTSTLKTFAGRSDIEQVYIPDTITEIGQATFLECEGLTEVEIPDSVQSIGASAFEGCRSLERVTLPNQITAISSSTFAYCSNLRDISIPDTVLSIGASAFYRCLSLERITIPDQVTAIGASAFKQCTNLQEVTIGKNVTTIGKEAFYECTMLNRLNFNAAAITESIIYDTFASAGTASDGIHVYFGKDVTRIPDQLFYTAAAANAPKIIEVVFEEGTSCAYIGSRAFQNLAMLNTISIPDSVTTIGNYAFEGCSNLVIMVEGTELPAALGTSWNGSCPVCVNVKAAGKTDYGQLYWVNQDDTVTLSQYTGSATELLLPGWIDGYPVREIANSAFTGCTGLVSVTLPDTVTKIGDAAFNGCTALKSVNIPDGVASIGATAFNGCISLTELEIPDSVTRIGQKAFYGCTGLNVIFRGETLPENLGEDWHLGASVCTDVSRIGYTDLNLSYYVTNSGSVVIGKYYGSATNCVIPEQIEGMPVTKIASSAFYNRYDLKTVNIPRQVVSIDNYAFYGCTNLTHIQIDAIALADLEYGNYSFDRAGKNSSSLTVTFGSEVSRIPGYLFYPDRWESTATRVYITDVVFEDGSVCQSIGDHAFRECYKLKNIRIPDTVTSIGVRAFYSCRAVSGFWIPSGVTNISASAFTGCRMLMFEADTLPDSYSLASADKTTVVLGAVSYGVTDEGFFYCTAKDGTAVVSNYTGNASDVKIPVKIEDAAVTGIACKAFYLCSTVTNVYIPDTVTFIGTDAFYNCDNLVSLEIPDSVCSIGSSAFSSCDKLTSIKLPSRLEEIPDKMAYFSKKLTNVIIPDGVKRIGYYAFGSCNGIKSIVIPASVEHIESDAFNYCQGLVTVTLPENDNLYIGSYAFTNCYRLKSIVIPKNAKIESNAFQYCSKLALVQINSPEIAKSITSGTSAGNLCNYAKTVIFPAEITEIGSYVTTNYTAIEDTTVNGIPCLAYSNHVHEWEEQSSTEWIECEQDGETTYLCSVCAMEKVVVEPAHKLGDWTVVTESSCTEAGEERRDCTNCDFHETREIPAAGHTEVMDAAVAATCITDGLSEGRHCAVCQEILLVQEVLPAIGHHFEGGTCTNCGIMENAEGPQIVSQPVDYIGMVGDMATFTVVAEGESLRYQWYFYDAEASRWKKSSDNTSATMRIEFKAYRNNQQYRCEISDAEGNVVITDVVQLIAREVELAILTQPKNHVGSVNDNVTMRVEATGNGLTYQWYYSADGGATWAKSGSPGYTTATLQPILRAYRDGYQFYCIISDIFGNCVTSNTATMVVRSSNVTIHSQPEDVTNGTLDQLHTFSVSASGENLEYRWEFSADGGNTWQLSWNQGYNTDTLTVRLYASRSGYLYRCKITSGLKTVAYTDAVELKLQEPSAAIVTQPLNAAVVSGKTIQFHVEATGTNLTYAWYRSNDKGATWNQTFLSGYNTATLSFTANASRAALYKCKITDGSGTVVWTDNVKLQIISTELKILSQPANVVCTNGDTAIFSVEAQGDGLKYLWYASSDGGETWTVSYLTGYNTAQFSFVVNTARAAKLYKCVITDVAGNTVETGNVSVTIE